MSPQQAKREPLGGGLCALSRARSDPAVFGEFYRAYAARVVVFFARRVVDGETASDLTAETFAVAYAKREQFRGQSVEEEQAWLFAIARRQLLRYWRKGNVERRMLDRLGLEPPATDADDIAYIEEAAALAELRTRVGAALLQLPPDQRSAVQERIMQGRTYAEIALEASVDEQVMRARVSRGLKTLQRRVGHLRLDTL